MQRVIRLLYGIALSFFVCASHGAGPLIKLGGWDTNGWPRLEISDPTNLVYTIEHSRTLTNWSTVAVLHGLEFTPNAPLLPYIDASSDADEQTRFYRVRSEPIEFDDDWRNQVYYPDDDFRNEQINFNGPETRWIKFAITTNEPTRVYYQNSWKYKFHYNFASARLPGFRGLTPIQFDEVSLQTNSQRIVLGAVLFSPRAEDREVGIQFVGQDPYTPQQIADWFRVVKTTIQPLDELRVVYIPSFEQVGVVEQNRPYFAAQGIEIGSLVDWDTGVNAYSTGWALGRLVFVPGEQIRQAYSNGDLKPQDILLTDAVPADVPFVSGILTLSPSTPNSHVAILAQSYSIPFVYLADPDLRAKAQVLVGSIVGVTAFPGFPHADIQLLDVSNVDPVLRQEIIATKEPEPLDITPKARYGAYFAPIDTLVPSDIKFFGGKAANFGFLRRQIPSNSPPAIAIAFDLWEDFMSQTNQGIVLRDRISARLNQHTYPPNISDLASDLFEIREFIEDDTVFTTAQQEAIIAALLGTFDPQTKIRFRSSTNVEDAENFTGAGLYDSYSGCLADDQDGDNSGPSICDSTEVNERGVFRAIRKVFASFYNDIAVLERMRHRVDESKVGMAILVHYSAPDPTEMANGVATITYTRSGGSTTYEGKMVTQKGAVSVTNPDGSAVPEVVKISRFGGTPFAGVDQWSSLVPFGANVLTWDADYKAFANLFDQVSGAFRAYYTNKTRYTLDFEYKKLLPGVLHVKQVREIPSSDPNAKITAYLLNEPSQWQVFQGEFGTVFANHRLKANLLLNTRDMKLTTSGLQQGIYSNAVVEYIHDGERRTLSGHPGSFSNAVHTVGPSDPYGTPITDSWTITQSNNQQRVSLTTTLRTSAGPDESPLLTLGNAQLEFRAVYSNAVPVIDFGPTTNFVTEESVLLRKPAMTNDSSIEVTRTISGQGGATISTSFYWPEPPSGATAGYTAPVVAWKETRIEGLTTNVIVLHDYYSQTYRPEHHNFSEHFIFEPALEPGISSAILDELRAKNIRQIYFFWGGGIDLPSYIYVAGENGLWRPLPKGP